MGIKGVIMKISEVIERLENIKERMGDIDCYTYNSYYKMYDRVDTLKYHFTFDKKDFVVIGYGSYD